MIDLAVNQIWQYGDNIKERWHITAIQDSYINMSRVKDNLIRDVYLIGAMYSGNWSLYKDVERCIICKTPVENDYVCTRCEHEI